MPFTPEEKLELSKRIKLAIEYSRERCVSYQYTRPAYQDLSSMGTPFTEPAAVMNAMRSMTSQETTNFIMALISNDEALREESIEHRLSSSRLYSYCKNRRGSKDPRCMTCDGCLKYQSVIQGMVAPHYQFSERM